MAIANLDSIGSLFNVLLLIKSPLAVVSRVRKTLRVLTTAAIAQIPAVLSKQGAVIGAVLSMRKFHRGVITDIRHIWIIAEYMTSQINWNNKIIEIQIIFSILRVSEHFSKMLVVSGVFNTIILDTMNYVNQDYMHVNYTLIVVYFMLLVTGSQSKNVSCFCLDMAQWRSLIGQSLCNAIYWSNMGFSVYWCSRWNGHIEYIETTAYEVLG
jgi:hypothetical protein